MTVHLLRDIEKLKKDLLALSAHVEESLQLAVQALEERDAVLARRVIDDDFLIDNMEVEVEEECLHILALYQPVAIDLRFIVAVLKINNDLERIGDLAVNMAERAEFLAARERINIPLDFRGMAAKAQTMLHQSLDALVNLNSELAREVIAADDEVDNMNREMLLQVQKAIHTDAQHLDRLIHYLLAARHLERVADHATNIAQEVIYLVEGDIVRHQAEDFRLLDGERD